jgi:folate-binding protein YgfZ
MEDYIGSQIADERNQTAFFSHNDPGYLKIAGSDRHAFIQRQTTNNIDLLTPERSLVTVLTSPAGRILDVLWVIDEGDTLGVLTLPGQGKQTLNFLQSRIFFMDKVILEEVSSEFSQIDLFGPGRNKLLLDLFQVQLNSENNILMTDVMGIPFRILTQKDLAYRLLVPRTAILKMRSELEAKGSTPLSPDNYEILRIEAGLPAAGHELTEDYTPLEVGFQWTVSDNKGCYTGQEVLARQVNYDKITRQLVGLMMSEIPQIGDTLYPSAQQQPIGIVTSTALSPRFGPIALAIVKRPFHQPGNELLIGDREKSLTAETTALPFQ